MSFGAVLCASALVLSVWFVNASAYLVGFGTEVTVTVTKSSKATTQGSGIDGRGYYEHDGERITVQLSNVGEGEEIVARTPLIPLDFGRGAKIHTDNSDAFNRSLSIIGVVMFGFLGYLILRNGWIIATKGPKRIGSSTREIISQFDDRGPTRS